MRWGTLPPISGLDRRAIVRRGAYQFLGLGAALIGAVLLLGHASLSYDELFSVYFAEQGPAYLLGPGWHQETNPPLYFLLLWGWIGLFGDQAAALRSLSLLAAAATLPVLYRVARAAGFGRGAWLPVFIYLTSALAARYGLMARPYALWLLALTIALLGLVEALSAATPARVGRWAAVFSASGLVALYLHDSTVIFLAAGEAVFLIAWLARRDVRLLAAWLLPQLLLLAGTPQILIILAQRSSANIAWIAPPSVAGAIQMAIELLTGRAFPFASFFQAAALFAPLIVVLILAPFKAPRALAPMGLLVLIALALLLGAGLLLPRTALWLLLPLALLQAGALWAVRPGWLRAALVALALAIGTGNTIDCLFNYQPEPWASFLAVLDSERQPSDAIVLLNGAPATAWRYYEGGKPASLYRWDATPIDGPGTAIRTIDDRVQQLQPIDDAGIRSLLRQGRGVWLISRLAAQRPAEDALAADFTVTRHLSRRSVDIVRLAP